MERNSQIRLGETLPRFVSHWMMACFGYFLNVLLPLIANWPEAPDMNFPRWWAVMLYAGGTSLLAAIINANLPVTPRELLKSAAFGFALNAMGEILLIS